ncbi:antA/AntB antirepressor family protein [Aggregatibacter actinomycetemcomitans]|uniref:antA/AntB antirepressor family protein n=1 Tax=Aggregatibacter actinomycetemcomitans TaxID=714 RepID=UPI002150C422|nr:antA/AntB antirepressor family protein [Aggregatibacter actinomycetemcomitans]
MANLIQISNNKINNSEVKTVNARELHSFLEVSTRFSDWIQRRINEYEFIENQDFIVLLKNEKNPIGGRPQKEIHISIDMAKELSMVERNEKGKQARQYFIEMEKVAKSTDPMMLLNDPVYSSHQCYHVAHWQPTTPAKRLTVFSAVVYPCKLLTVARIFAL